MKLPLLITTAAILAGAAITGAPPAHATPSNCQVIPWGLFGVQRRAICDGPIQPDGSWMRSRLIAIPAHQTPATSSCTSGSYTSYCTFYPGGWVEEQDLDDETYRVTPDTVLPDEPGYLGQGTIT